MELRQLEYFLAVADELHFGRAAQRLVIAPSVVSEQIRRLERELGADLFERSTRTVRLTDAGRALVPHAESVLGAVEGARMAVGRTGPGSPTVLRLGTCAGLADRLTAVLDRLHRSAPSARVEMRSMPQDQRLRHLQSGELDVAFVSGGPPRLRGVTVQHSWNDALVAAVPTGTVGDRAELAELSAWPLRIASRERGPALHDALTDAFARAGVAPTFGTEFTTDQDTLSAIAGHDRAWSVFYAAKAKWMRWPGVDLVPFADPGISVATHLVTGRTGASDAVSALVEVCRTSFGDS